jgi:hypothetical protein
MREVPKIAVLLGEVRLSWVKSAEIRSSSDEVPEIAVLLGEIRLS